MTFFGPDGKRKEPRSHSPFGTEPWSVERRRDLVEWLRERDTHNGLTAREIVAVSGVYDRPFDAANRVSQCRHDLTRPAAAGYLLREGRPSRWSLRHDAPARAVDNAAVVVA